MTLVIKAQEILFSTTDNIHATPINVKTQIVLKLVSPITLWILWKHRCRRAGLPQSKRALGDVIAGDMG